MRILLIDNNTRHLIELKKLATKYASELKVIKYNKINLRSASKFDLIVLSGGKKMDIPENRARLKREIELIKKANVPILGICLGFELIADTFGAKLKKRNERLTGLIDIKIIKKDNIFKGKKKFRAYVAHKWYLDSLPKKLVSSHIPGGGIEVFKHKYKSIYGFQFHPEITKKGNEGKIIFDNLLASLQISDI